MLLGWAEVLLDGFTENDVSFYLITLRAFSGLNSINFSDFAAKSCIFYLSASVISILFFESSFYA